MATSEIYIGESPESSHLVDKLPEAGYTQPVSQQLGGLSVVARIIGMVLDRSWVRSSYVSLVTEIVPGIVLVL